MGKSAFASSTKLYKVDEEGWLKNLKRGIIALVETRSTSDYIEEERMKARRNLEKASKHKLLHPILERAFKEVKKEYEEIGAKKKASQAVQDIFWRDFSVVEKMYLQK
ncbi:MAG: hypothetical protein LBG48_02435 [Rickettsiales bacterium]|nr:hypothetical protein [Rickettsiales bacterium]